MRKVKLRMNEQQKRASKKLDISISQVNRLTTTFIYLSKKVKQIHIFGRNAFNCILHLKFNATVFSTLYSFF